jgi:ornithine carbamoyltransferase
MAGVSVHVASPHGYELPQRVIDEASRIATGGAEVRCFADANGRCRRSRRDLYRRVGVDGRGKRGRTARRLVFAPYQVNEQLMSRAAPVRCSCTACQRIEATKSPPRSSSQTASVVFDQAENRLHTQKALLLMLLASEASSR